MRPDHSNADNSRVRNEPSKPMSPIIGVMGSGIDSYDELATEVAYEIAVHDAYLLTGGGAGVMASVAKYYKKANPNGIVIGILPSQSEGSSQAPNGYPNEWVDIAIRTHLHLSGREGTSPMSRNHINILSSAAIVALPGGAGTVSEIHLAYTYKRPVIVYHGPYSRLADIPRLVPQTSDINIVSSFLAQNLE